MPTTPYSAIDHFELNGNPEVPINDAFDDLDGRSVAYLAVATGDADVNLATTLDGDGDAVAHRYRAFEFTGTLTAGRTVTLPDAPGVWHVWNNTAGGFDLTFATAGGTASVAVAAGKWATVVVEAGDFDVRAVSSALAINDLTDVDTAGKQDRDALVYDAASAKWVPGPGGLPTGYVTGFKLANNATDADHDLEIGAGAARAQADTVDAVLAGTLIKQIDAAWSEGSNAGGLFTGTVAASTWYHLVLIREDASGDVDAGFDTDPGGASKPVGWTVMRRLGAVLTDGLANIRGFQHLAEHGLFLWNDPILDIDVADQGASAVARSLSVPPGLAVEARLNVYLSHASAQTLLYLRQPGTSDEAPSTGAGPLGSLRSGASGAFQVGQVEVFTDTLGRIESRADQAATSLKIATLGWAEGLGHGSSGGGGGGLIDDLGTFSASAGASIDCVEGSNDWTLYHTIEFIINAHPDSDDTEMWIRIDSGSGFISTGTPYAYALSGLNAAGSGGNQSSQAANQILLGTQMGGDSGSQWQGRVLMSDPGREHNAGWQAFRIEAETTNDPAFENYRNGGGWWEGTLRVVAVQFRASTGTVTGSVYVRGHRKSI